MVHTSDGVDAKSDILSLLTEQADELSDGVLSLSYTQTISRYDDDVLSLCHHLNNIIRVQLYNMTRK